MPHCFTMATITISEEQWSRVLQDVERLVEDVATLVDQDEIARQRRSDIEKRPSLGKSERELDDYLRKRGVKVN